VEIIDDGIGFDTSKRQYAGMGLENMRQRAALLNGELTVESTPGEGTCVRLRVGD
jgi:signal transduction histidine kinase